MVDGGVHEPPGRAAQGLIAWAVHVWPYVNGKALFQGIRLGSLDAEDMLDILHYLFEEDNHFVSEESANSRSGLRDNMYKDLYNKEYKYKYVSKSKSSSSVGNAEDFGTFSVEDADAMSVTPFNPRETKPYVPPTPFDPNKQNPFDGILDGPLN